jgi:hypothetical protein
MQSILIAALLTLSSVYAMSNGAPVCTIGAAAPEGTHLSTNSTVTGPLSVGTFIVTLNSDTLDPAVSTTINVLENHYIAVTSVAGDKPYRGVLVIASSASTNFTSAVLQPAGVSEDTLKTSLPCAEIGRAGVTHNSSDTKTITYYTLIVPKNLADLKLDVNVVVANNAINGSIYYYNQFSFNVTSAPPPPTAAPVKPRIRCGLFGLAIFCPLTYCGFLGRLIFGSKNC